MMKSKGCFKKLGSFEARKCGINSRAPTGFSFDTKWSMEADGQNCYLEFRLKFPSLE